jgi:hypothetical protein
VLATITMHGVLPGLAAYVATKGAAASKTRALARELLRAALLRTAR